MEPQRVGFFDDFSWDPEDVGVTVAQGGDAFSYLIDHLTHGFHLGIQHFVYADKVRAHDVPVNMLECQPEIDQRDHAVLENCDRLPGIGIFEAGGREVGDFVGR